MALYDNCLLYTSRCVYETGARRHGFAKLLSGPLQGLLRKRQHLAAERAFDAALREHEADSTMGSVALVGAGPGDPGLLTLRCLLYTSRCV